MLASTRQGEGMQSAGHNTQEVPPLAENCLVQMPVPSMGSAVA